MVLGKNMIPMFCQTAQRSGSRPVNGRRATTFIHRICWWRAFFFAPAVIAGLEQPGSLTSDWACCGPAVQLPVFDFCNLGPQRERAGGAGHWHSFGIATSASDWIVVGGPASVECLGATAIAGKTVVSHHLMSNRELEARVTSLERELADLYITVRALQVRINTAESQDQEFELIASTPSTQSGPIAAGQPKAKASARSAEAVPEGAARNQILKQIGLWIRRALEGNYRGLSGRELLPGGSRYHFIARSFSGEVFDTARVVSPWAVAERVVKYRGDTGDLVLVGLCRWEDRIVVVQWARLGLSSVQDGGGSAWDTCQWYRRWTCRSFRGFACSSVVVGRFRSRSRIPHCMFFCFKFRRGFENHIYPNYRSSKSFALWLCL